MRASERDRERARVRVWVWGRKKDREMINGFLFQWRRITWDTLPSCSFSWSEITELPKRERVIHWWETMNLRRFHDPTRNEMQLTEFEFCDFRVRQCHTHTRMRSFFAIPTIMFDKPEMNSPTCVRLGMSFKSIDQLRARLLSGKTPASIGCKQTYVIGDCCGCVKPRY